VPFVPLALLFLTSKAFRVLVPPQEWLVDPKELADLNAKAALSRGSDLFDSRLIGAAMLVGVAAAALTTLFTPAGRKDALGTAKAFFEGAGYAFAEIVAIIVAATCFAEGVKLIGVGRLIGSLATAAPALLVPTAGLFPTAFAAVSGSGMAATQGLFEFFVGPALRQNVDPVHLGSIVSLGAAAGRTMSPVAAVVLMCAKMTDTSALDLVKRVAPPLLCGVLAMIVLGTLMTVADGR
jgi:DcuC family C4-dicarboxylate transporter